MKGGLGNGVNWLRSCFIILIDITIVLNCCTLGRNLYCQLDVFLNLQLYSELPQSNTQTDPLAIFRPMGAT